MFNYAGVEQFAFDHGADVNDIFMDQNRVYVCGADGGVGNLTHEAYDLTAMTQTWNADHGGTLQTIIGDGVDVFIGGAAGTAGVHIRRIAALTGTILDDIIDAAVPRKKCMVVTENELYVATGTDVLSRLTKHGDTGVPGLLINMGSKTFSGSAVWTGLAVDERFVYCCIDDGIVAGRRVHLAPLVGRASDGTLRETPLSGPRGAWYKAR